MCVIANVVRCVWDDVADLKDAGMLCAVAMTTRSQLDKLHANGSTRPDLAPVAYCRTWSPCQRRNIFPGLFRVCVCEREREM